MRYAVYLANQNNCVVRDTFNGKFLMADHKSQYYVTTFFLHNMDLSTIKPEEYNNWWSHFSLSEMINVFDKKPIYETNELHNLKIIDEILPEYFI